MPNCNTNNHLKLLINALRSGEFKKGRWRLKAGDRYCTKGVACEIYSRETKNGKWLYNGGISSDDNYIYPIEYFVINDKSFIYDSDVDWPGEVAKWYGINKTCRETPVKFNDIDNLTIERLNDEFNLSFDEMASVIEDNFLFKENGNAN